MLEKRNESTDNVLKPKIDPMISIFSNNIKK